MKIGSTNSLGETIKKLRIARGMTQSKLAEAVNISDSHLSKIETGIKQPGIHTYLKIMEILEAEIVMKDKDETVKGMCVAKAREIIWNSTEKEARYLIKVLESISENLDLVLQS